MQHLLKLIFSVFLIVFSTSVIAAAPTPAKEETTPTPPEGALPADQIPPIMNIGKPLPAPAPTSAENEVVDE